MTTTAKLSDLLATDAMTMTVKPGTPGPDFTAGAKGYVVTLAYDGRTMTVPFTMGPAHTTGPTLRGVLECVLSDASTLDNSRGFTDWAADLGFEHEQTNDLRAYRRALGIYNATVAQTNDLRALLGADYEQWVYADHND